MKKLVLTIAFLLISRSAFAALAFVASATGTTSTHPCTVNVPAGTTNGMCMILDWSYPTTTAPTTPSGWTLIRQDTDGSGSISNLYYRIASSEPSSYTFTFTPSGFQTCAIATYSGCSGSPIGATSGNSSNGTPSSNEVALSITTTANNSFTLSEYEFYYGATTATLPGTLTQRYNQSAGAFNHVGEAMGDKSVVTSGTASGNQTATLDMNGNWVAQQIELLAMPAATPTATATATATATVTATATATGTASTSATPTATATATATATHTATATATSTATATPTGVPTVTTGTGSCTLASNGVQTNNVLIGAVVYDSTQGTNTLTVPPNWNLFKTWNLGGADGNWYWHTVTASEPATYTWSLNANKVMSCGYDVITNSPDPTNPIDVVGVAAINCASSTCTAQGVTTTQANDILGYGGGTFLLGVICYPSGFQPGFEVGGTFQQMGIEDSHQYTCGAAGPTGTISGCVGGAGQAANFVFALKGAASCTTTPTATATATATASPTGVATPSATATATISVICPTPGIEGKLGSGYCPPGCPHCPPKE